ncbi:uncharacterized protein IUM83_09026 [Phytophthora cinnamomi]|uniref:uncharacterized protein n=1 Tax=Phytophthora cinnamomi TaxID=4785 RepID=UPI00355A7DF6|nr:hypothetical protein IUM83_09026 [Phytophthora cinnamomi]
MEKEKHRMKKKKHQTEQQVHKAKLAKAQTETAFARASLAASKFQTIWIMLERKISRDDLPIMYEHFAQVEDKQCCCVQREQYN